MRYTNQSFDSQQATIIGLSMYGVWGELDIAQFYMSTDTDTNIPLPR